MSTHVRSSKNNNWTNYGMNTKTRPMSHRGLQSCSLCIFKCLLAGLTIYQYGLWVYYPNKCRILNICFKNVAKCTNLYAREKHGYTMSDMASVVIRHSEHEKKILLFVFGKAGSD